MSGLGEVEWQFIQDVDMKAAVGQGGLRHFWSSTSEVPSGIVELVEKTEDERRQEKYRKKKEKRKENKEKKKKESENEKGRSAVGDPAGTPPSHALEDRPIHFQYAEGSMNLTMMVGPDFDDNPNGSAMRQLCFQVSGIYSDRLRIPSSVSDMKFNFTILARDSLLVTLKDDEMGLGFEDQLKTCRKSLSDALFKNEELEDSLDNFQVSSDFEKLRAEVADMKADLGKTQSKASYLEEENTTLQSRVATLQSQVVTHQSLIDQLLANAELHYATRRRILVQDARERLLEKLELDEKPTEVNWDKFIEALSPAEKVVVGASDDVLELMGTSLYTLNQKVHTADSRVEMAHAVNYIKITTLKTKWQALFKFLYGTNSEDVEFGNQS